MPIFSSVLRRLLVFAAAFSLVSCSATPNIQPQVNSLVVARRFDQAVRQLESRPNPYGKNNELLYLLDKGMTLHLAGRYRDSIDSFEKAKQIYDRLYTSSVSKIAGSWAWNDAALPYRGEDFERVLINIFQALNYASLGEWDEALVEARDVDSKLTAINNRYRPGEKNAYREDAFARLLMGILYEASGTSSDLNDAFISYRKALEAYESDYRSHYGLEPPQLLKENLLAAAEGMGKGEFQKYRRKFGNINFTGLDRKKQKAEVYLIHYHGLSPLKRPAALILPLPEGYFTRFAFPTFEPRYYSKEAQVFAAESKNGEKRAGTELGEDIEGLAIKNLADRKVRIIAKSVARPLVKYAAERAIEAKVRENNGKTAAQVVRYGASFYNVISEQADLRSWMTLPAQIRIAGLTLEPGQYTFSLDGRTVGEAEVAAGEKKFFIVRTTY